MHDRPTHVVNVVFCPVDVKGRKYLERNAKYYPHSICKRSDFYTSIFISALSFPINVYMNNEHTLYTKSTPPKVPTQGTPKETHISHHFLMGTPKVPGSDHDAECFQFQTGEHPQNRWHNNGSESIAVRNSDHTPYGG